MKKKILFVLVIGILSLAKLIAQDNTWSKDGRNSVYNEFLNDLTSYKTLTQDQKESLGLCCLGEITKEYNMKEYQSKIDVELKRIKSATITQCSKNLGFELANQTEATTGSNDWTKESKTILYNSAMNVFNKYQLTQQQKESLSLCYVNELTSKYSKSQLDAMLDAEVKKTKNTVYQSCVEKSGITLKSNAPKTITAKSISGGWQSYDFDIYFYDTGEYEKHMDKGPNKKTKGKWFLEGTTIILVHDKNVKEEFEITNYTGDAMKFENKETNTEFHLKKFY